MITTLVVVVVNSSLFNMISGAESKLCFFKVYCCHYNSALLLNTIFLFLLVDCVLLEQSQRRSKDRHTLSTLRSNPSYRQAHASTTIPKAASLPGSRTWSSSYSPPSPPPIMGKWAPAEYERVCTEKLKHLL